MSGRLQAPLLPIASLALLAACASGSPGVPLGPGGKADLGHEESAAEREELGRACGRALAELAPIGTGLSGEADAALRDAISTCLSGYVAIPTLNPPGDEHFGVEFLAAAFGELGFPARAVEHLDASGRPRQSFIATLPAGGAESYDWSAPDATESVILLNHIDVVPAVPEQWSDPSLPFSGAVGPRPGGGGEDYVWGRGALDMKGLAVLQMAALALLDASGEPIEKTVHFVAVADEEVAGTGARGVLDDMRPGGELEALMSAGLVLNEGGLGMRDALGAETVAQVVATEEKGGAWVRVRSPGPDELFDALSRVDVYPHGGFFDFDLFDDPAWGCRLTRVETPPELQKFNVVASRVTARLACDERPDPGELVAAFEEGAEVEVRDLGAQTEIEVVSSSSEHGSISRAPSAAEHLAMALSELDIANVEDYAAPSFYDYVATDATRELIDRIGTNHNFRFVPHVPHLSDVVGWLSLLEQVFLEYLGGQLLTDRLFRTSCSWTGINVSEGEATATLDCRNIIPPRGEDLAERLAELVAPSGSEIEIASVWNFTASPVDHAAVRIMEEELARESTGDPKTVIAPFLMPAGSDNTYFRDPHRIDAEVDPIPSYGFFPIIGDADLISTQHGSDERFPVSEAAPGSRRYYRVLSRLVGGPR